VILERVQRGGEVDAPALQRSLDLAGNYLCPVGLVTRFPGGVVPLGWIICDGRAVSRRENWDLFALVGTSYGSGDGVSTFNVPTLTNPGPSSVPYVIRA
jgi:hypothetical protein